VLRKLLAGLALLTSFALHAQQLPLIDTHSHLDHGGNIGSLGAALDSALADMDRLGVRLSILLPPPQVASLRVVYDCDALQFAVRRQPGRIALVAGGGTLNPMIQSTAADGVTEDAKRRFRALAEEAAACGAKGFGEIAAHHISHGRMGAQHPYEWVPPDHPLLLLLADIAAEKGLPIDLHLDLVPADMPRPDRPAFNPSNPAVFKENLAAFERLLAHNRKARIIWAHAGTDPLQTRTPQIQRELLGRHANLFMSLRPGPGGPHPTFALDPQGALKPEWLALLRDFPDRFVLGSDQFHPPFASARRTPAEGYDNLRRLIEQLPPALARTIAHENAERLYGLAR
jgi:predicted TIM-barrel fold metal-dependent hydrolase